MLENIYSSKFLIDELRQSPFSLYIERLVEKHLAEGYSLQRIHHGLSGIVRFVRWSAQKRVTLKTLNKKHVDEFLLQLSEKIVNAKVYGLPFFCRKLFLLIEEGTGKTLLEKPDSGFSTSIQKHVEVYIAYLVNEKGLSSMSIPRMSRAIEVYLQWKFNEKTINTKKISAKCLLEFIKMRSKSRTPKSLQTENSSIKTYLRYLFGQGLTSSDLSHSLPKVAGWRNQNHIYTLTEKELKHLLESVDQRTSRGIREFTILLVIIQYGLRAIEIARIRLPDILWDQNKLLVRGKGRKLSELPLTSDVRTALERYIELARPFSNLNYLFLTTRAPVKQIDDKAGVSCVVQRAMRKAQINKPVLGVRLLRSTVASRILNNGGTIQEVKELLRHSHMDTTARYLRVDFNRLSLATLPWPETKFRRRKL
jgi:integrase/recombinase XerD